MPRQGFETLIQTEVPVQRPMTRSLSPSRSMSKAATLWTPWRTLGGEKPTAPFHPLLAPAISASSRSVTFGGPPRLW